jgi:WD40 repeat protein
VPNLSLTTDKVSSTAKTGGQASYALYSVADGKIMQHSIQFSSGNNIQPQNIQTVNFFKEVTRFMSERASPLPSTENAPLAEPELAQGLLGKKNMFEQANGLTEFSVLKYDEQSYFFAIGKFDGSIEVYQSLLAENKLRRLGTFFNHQKLVTIIKWNKPAYASKNNEMTLMASGSNDHNIVVVDFGSFVSELESEQFAKLDLKLFSKYKHKLSGHKERITSISWSVSNGSNVLASCSYDCTVQVSYIFSFQLNLNYV